MSTPPGEGMRGRAGMRTWWTAPPRIRHTSETKPFFLTSEFLLLILYLMGLGIAAGTSAHIDDRFFWIAATVVTAFYMLSRGVAKSGSVSRARDPREDIDIGRD